MLNASMPIKRMKREVKKRIILSMENAIALRQKPP
jgi:hypothetical protein